MKYYGFKQEKLVGKVSSLNRNLGTWIGILGTFIFLVSAAEAGGFKGRMSGVFFLTILYPALLWFLTLLSDEHDWVETTMQVFVSIGLASSILLLFIINQYVYSMIMLIVFNICILILLNKKPKHDYVDEPDKLDEV